MEEAIRKQIGQLFVVGFHGKTVTDEIKELIHTYYVGSIILFARNLGTLQEVKELTVALQKEAQAAGYTHPLLICTDQENGIVKRLSEEFGTYPGAMALGATENIELAYAIGGQTGKQLHELGINWNLAPVIDVNNNADNPVIGVRSFGEDPECVAAFGKAVMEGLYNGGVTTALKHFPGHGDTTVDSHVALPHISHDLDTLKKRELIPFEACIEAGAETIMSAHIVFPALEPEEGRPATLSKVILTDLLRGDLGFEGVITTDCLEMDAIAQTIGTEEGALQALQAGADLAMISHTFDRQKGAIERVYQAVEKGEWSKEYVFQSFDRVQQLKEKRLSWGEATTLKSIHLNKQKENPLAYQAYQKSVTLVKAGETIERTDRVLVLQPDEEQTTIAEDKKETQSVLLDAVQKVANGPVNVELLSSRLSEQQRLHIIEEGKKADAVLVGVYSLAEHKEWQLLIEDLSEEVPVYFIGMKDPYSGKTLANVEMWLNTYEPTKIPVQIAVEACFGLTNPTGKTPVTI